MNEFLKNLKYDRNGLIPAIIQDIKDNRVLMLGYMNEEAVKRTIAMGQTCFWSRKRKAYWIKGQESGNAQVVKEIYFDCDGDALLVKVEQQGGAACHRGYRSCFYRRKTDRGEYEIVEQKVFNPEDVYKRQGPNSVWTL